MPPSPPWKDDDGRWSMEQMKKLILCIKKRRILYDTQLESTSKTDTETAWKEVAQNMGLTVASCKNKWRNIRNCYSRDLRKRKTASHKPYYLEEYVRFVRPHLELRSPALCKLKRARERDDEPAPAEEENSEQGLESFEIDLETEQQRPKTEPESLESDDEDNDARDASFSFVAPESAGEDADMLFLRSVWPDMQAMSPRNKRRFKIAVLKLCHEILGMKEGDD